MTQCYKMTAAAPGVQPSPAVSSPLACWLAQGVQVRKKKSGLLFYDYRGSRLYFLPAGDLLGDDFFSPWQTVGQLVKDIHARRGLPSPQAEDYVQQVLDKLAAKGLIFGTWPRRGAPGRRTRSRKRTPWIANS
jgi:putative mycofactocin binding protein MftB